MIKSQLIVKDYEPSSDCVLIGSQYKIFPDCPNIRNMIFFISGTFNIIFLCIVTTYVISVIKNVSSFPTLHCKHRIILIMFNLRKILLSQFVYNKSNYLTNNWTTKQNPAVVRPVANWVCYTIHLDITSIIPIVIKCWIHPIR